MAVCDVDVEGALDTVEELRLLGVKAFPYEVFVNICNLNAHLNIENLAI